MSFNNFNQTELLFNDIVNLITENYKFELTAL